MMGNGNSVFATLQSIPKAMGSMHGLRRRGDAVDQVLACQGNLPWPEWSIAVGS